MQEKGSKNDRLKALHLRIWVSGVIATAVFVLINWLLSRATYSGLEAIVHVIVFLPVWVIMHYFIYRKLFKQIKAE